MLRGDPELAPPEWDARVLPSLECVTTTGRGGAVIAFDWNGLTPGDEVLVHEHLSKAYAAPKHGVVAFVHVRRPLNEVGIDVEEGDGHRVAWPTRQEVHAAGPAATADCFWCAPPPRPMPTDPEARGDRPSSIRQTPALRAG